MSLIIDRRIPQDKEPGVVHKALRSFLRKVDYRYPASYFIVDLDWSPAADIHAHIVTDLGQVRRKRLTATGWELRRLWMETIGSENVKNFQLDKYEEDYYVSYLTAPQIGKGRIWSIVNKMYIREVKLETIYFYNEIERQQFNRILKRMIREADVHESNFRRIDKNNGYNNYLTEELLRKAFARFKA